MFYLFLFILSELLFGKEILCVVISNCEGYTSSVNMVNPYIFEEVGEILTSSDNIPTIGTTTVNGNVPVAGSVTFGGEVRASGTVKIVAQSRPPTKPRRKASRRQEPLAFMLLTPRSASGKKMPIIPIRLPAKSLPTPPVIPAVFPITSQTIRQINPTDLPPTYIPITTVPPIIPSLAVPSVPPEDIPGCANVVITGNELPLTGSTFVDAVLPTTGDFAFGGYIPAKGSVVITCKSY